MKSSRIDRDDPSSPPLQAQAPDSSLFREDQDADPQDQEEDRISTSAGHSPPTVTSTRSGSTLRKKGMNVESRVTQLRDLITKTQTQINDAQQRLDENCVQLKECYGIVSAQQTPPSKDPSEVVDSLVSSKGLSGIQVNGYHGDEEIIDQARQVVKNNIKQLNMYNELKDVSMALLGMIAEAEGKRLQEVMDERDIKCDKS